ncbi:MAG: hypothetical protein H6607_06375 [Flavobacteriales bacterium]|nr:hypothetical protein [Flavobacteriales bacterium]
MLKKFTLVAFGLILFTTTFAQGRIEGYLTPGIGYRQLSTSSTLLKDSFSNADKWRQNWSGGIKYLISLDKYTKIQVGLEYKGRSFTRVRSGLKFHDTIHPEVGWLKDLSQTTNEKNAYYHMKYRYISIPVIFQKVYSRKLFMNKMYFEFASGVEFDLRYADKMAIFLKGFSVDGNNTFKVSNYYKPDLFNVSLNIGSRMEYKLSERSDFSVQPNFTFPLLVSAKDDFTKIRLWQMGVAVGVNYMLK